MLRVGKVIMKVGLRWPLGGLMLQDIAYLA